MATFSSSPLIVGVIAKLITGSGKPISGTSVATSLSSSRSPVCTSFSFATAPMSPGPNSSAGMCSLPCWKSSAPIRSLACVRASTSVCSGRTEPWRTRKRLIRPAKGSAIVLNTKAAVSAPSMCVIEPIFAGLGMPSTIRSSSACVPRFCVATPQATGKTIPRVTASFSACATSSTPSSCPSR